MMITLVLAVSSALVISFLCSIFESVLLSISHSQIETMNRSGSRAGKILSGFKGEMDVPIAAILILNTVAHTVGSSVGGASYVQVFSTGTFWLFNVVFTIAVLLFTEIVPKTLGISFARRLAAPVALAVGGLVKLLSPVLFLTRKLSSVLRTKSEEPVTSVEEIRLLAAMGRAQGVVGRNAAQIIEGAAQLRDLRAQDIMVPRNRLVSLSRARSLEENLETVRTSGHSRFPLTPTEELDEVEGIVLAKEFLFHLRDQATRGKGDQVDWDTIVSEPILIPETKALNELLPAFQEARRHLAVVVDEYGGVSGVVTLEDVLEELVGEIRDESDRLDASVEMDRDRRVTCHGSAETRKVFSLIGIEAESEAVTISGFLATQLGVVPKTGDETTFEGFRFRVLRASERRAEKVEITPLPEEPAIESDAQ